MSVQLWKDVRVFKYLESFRVEFNDASKLNYIVEKFCFRQSNFSTLEYIKQHQNVNWDWAMISRVCHLRDICQNMELPWNWGEVSKNTTLTMLFVQGHQDLPFDWFALSLKY